MRGGQRVQAEAVHATPRLAQVVRARAEVALAAQLGIEGLSKRINVLTTTTDHISPSNYK